MVGEKPIHIFIFRYYDKNETQPRWTSGFSTQLPAYWHTSCLRRAHQCLHICSLPIPTNLIYLHLPSSAEVLLNLLFAQAQPFRVIFDSFTFSVYPLSTSRLWNSYTHPTYGMSQNHCMTTCSLYVQTCHDYSYHLVPATTSSSLESYNTFLN